MVNSDQRFGFFGELRDQPFSNSFARPIFSRTWRRLDLMGNGPPVRLIHAQALETRGCSLRARIVDANVSLECGVHLKDSLSLLPASPRSPSVTTTKLAP